MISIANIWFIAKGISLDIINMLILYQVICGLGILF